MARGSVRPVLTRYLVDHLGEIVHADTIMSETGLTRTQIQQGIVGLIGRGVRISIEMPSNAWRYLGPENGSAPVGELVPVTEVKTGVVTVKDTRGTLYEEIGRSPDDTFVILQDAEGGLWRAEVLR